MEAEVDIILEQIELQAKLLNYFLGSNKSNINQKLCSDLTNGYEHENSSFVAFLESAPRDVIKNAGTSSKGICEP